MKTTLPCILTGAFALFQSHAAAKDEDGQVRQAAAIMQRFKAMPEGQIPREVLRDAMGLAILTVVKGGFVLTAKFGEGVVVARTARGWSGPSFIRTGGIGFGAQIGGEVTEFVIILNTPEAVKAFAAGTNVELGGALSVAAGPVGRSAGAGVMRKAAVYTYSLSKGLFAGVSLEGAVIKTNDKANNRYYRAQGQPGSRDILGGRIVPPPGAAVLLDKL
jgi:lipid-binding SYLF domain-containing protein